MSLSAVPDNIPQYRADGTSNSAYSKGLSRSLDAKQSRKRKYAEAELSSDGGRSHNIGIVLPCSNGSSKPLISKYLIPRSLLPLAYLDPAVDGDLTSGSRLFAAQIAPLEKEENGTQSSQPQVLLAQSRDCGRFYAIERVNSGLYAFCRLGQWVAENTLKHLAQRVLAYTSCQPRTEPPEEQNTFAKEWWRTTIAPADDLSRVSSLDPDAIVRARHFKLSLGRPSRRNSTPVPVPVEASPVATETIVSAPNDAPNNCIQSPEDSLKIIKTQYQDALYLSRAPLAYFAKGPLSRARASFLYDESLGNDYLKLTQYLRAMILDLQVMDKKYRETLPALIKGLPFTPLSDGEDAPIIEEIQRKSRRSKKEKIGKDGLYAGEDVGIARWWLGRDRADVLRDTEDANQESITENILNLRRREAQLQIILLLETLALEGNAIASVTNSVNLDDDRHDHDGSIPKAKKAKRPQDLHMLLDLLADRLCIWQSMSVEVEKPEPNQRPQEGVAPKRADHSNNDELRQFCIDVVVPFYGSRLPEASTLLCQKLGGPKDPSPKRSTIKVLEAKSKASMKPGAPLPRPQQRRHRRTLERVLTAEKSSQQRKKPSLSRSATEPLVQVKREVSDLTLSTIPLNKVAMSKRYTQREVDLRASTQAAESKQKKKIAIEQELQGAIAAIKRPNPKMAGVEFVEAVEKRQAESQSRKTTKFVRKPSTQDFQVMATPSRTKNAGSYILPTLPETQRAALPTEVSEVPPSSANQMVPSSTGKFPDTRSYGKSYKGLENRKQLAHLDQTPSRGPSRFVDRSCPSGGEPPFFTYSQPQAQIPTTLTSGVQETPSKSSDLQSSRLPKSEFSTLVTPSKAVPEGNSPLDATSPFSQAEEPDLYASLGWNYDVDD